MPEEDMDYLDVSAFVNAIDTAEGSSEEEADPEAFS